MSTKRLPQINRRPEYNSSGHYNWDLGNVAFDGFDRIKEIRERYESNQKEYREMFRPVGKKKRTKSQEYMCTKKEPL